MTPEIAGKMQEARKRLRDEFAAAAIMPIVVMGIFGDTKIPDDESPSVYLARLAYDLADAMLEARK